MARLLRLILCFLLIPLHSQAQERLLLLDDLYDPRERVNFEGNYPRALQWFSDGQHYLQEDSDRLLKVNAETGVAEALFDGDQLKTAFEQIPGIGAREAQSAVRGGRKTLCPAENGLLIHHSNDLFHYRLSSGSLKRLTDSEAEEREAAFSPSGDLLGFVRDNDLYVVPSQGGPERRLTWDGGRDVLNGLLDWIYQEEIFGRGQFRGFWWGPDSNRLAFLRLDESQVPEFVLVNHKSKHLDLQSLRYPKAGDPNPTVQLGIASVGDGKICWADLGKYSPDDFLIVGVSWKPDASKVVLQVQDRRQTWLDLILVDPSSGRTTRILRETSEAWVSVLADPFWLRDGSFLWQSERTGFRHLYRYSSQGKLLGILTSGEWDVVEVTSVNEESRYIYFLATKDSHLERHLYRVGLDGSGLVRITKRSGVHEVLFAPDSNHYLDTWSDLTTPPQVGLFDAQGTLRRTVAANEVPVLQDYNFGDTRFTEVVMRDGFKLMGLMIKPPQFDPRQRYPVLCHTYSGPYSPRIIGQRVLNKWDGTGFLWHQLLAQKGYVIWIFDSRTSSGKGVSQAWPAYRQLGTVEYRDLEDMVSWLKSRCFVDGSRIGLWGWSYGGYMTLYAMTRGDNFKVGIAGAPVTDWSLYDSVYTERYMGLPSENRKGYEDSSILRAAKNLKGRLLLIHGAMDDNVHVQNSYKLVDALQNAGQQFELMIYPQSRHTVSEPQRIKQLKTLMTEFICTNL